MKVIVLGADGYLGWPTAMHLAARGHEVVAVDNYYKRRITHQENRPSLTEHMTHVERAKIFADDTGHSISTYALDCTEFKAMKEMIEQEEPDAIIHYAEQPSGPYSMRTYNNAKETLENNTGSTLALAWAVMEVDPSIHIVKLGTAGEYGTPNIDIEEGWLEIEHKGRKETRLFPREAGSFYHTTKILDTDILWFWVRVRGLRVTDLMQGPVYGMLTDEIRKNDRLGTTFFYDDIFGTVINRFCAQVLKGIPLTVYGKGKQVRGYLNLIDTLQCVQLAVENPAGQGELRIMNQYTEQFSVLEIAERVVDAAQAMGISDARYESIPNPRIEKEDHYYNMVLTELPKLGLKPNLLTRDVLAEMLERLSPLKDKINPEIVYPKVTWTK